MWIDNDGGSIDAHGNSTPFRYQKLPIWQADNRNFWYTWNLFDKKKSKKLVDRMYLYSIRKVLPPLESQSCVQIT